MSEAAKTEPVWVYWKARALVATTQPGNPEAVALYQSIASVRGFYEQLALEELGQKSSLQPSQQPSAPKKKKAHA
jgi:soluble lytic murein transglycosylase